nr:MAG TPA: hypothetical protein [Caudoviricetes sp.]
MRLLSFLVSLFQLKISFVIEKMTSNKQKTL